MTLYTDILSEINAGRLADSWTTSDLLANNFLTGNYHESGLRTAPPNYSDSAPNANLGEGHPVRNGAIPIYRRVGRRGRALLYSLL